MPKIKIVVTGIDGKTVNVQLKIERENGESVLAFPMWKGFEIDLTQIINDSNEHAANQSN